ncbi:aldo/keto reductase [Polyangium jinanense]|uniref:HEAT repeat domain-containing protein n=1 Tax=Polyangium jinanense TaxID=2829994 RepID=A0A9X4AQ65_9BACT|nr:aldo/keto reductase [Polyangium jinanense]MDC3980016.1 HEAT repeat domain-containing protein [Polyangium jinanense]
MDRSSPATPPALVRLLDEDAEVRRDAVETLDPRPLPARFALRQAMLGDEDALVRAAAAQKLGEMRSRRFAFAFVEALDDVMPSVRDRAYRALARLESRDVLPYAGRAIRKEPVWWVRRSAVRAAAAAGGKDALSLLVEALADPFWRVRHAAVQALVVLGEDDFEVREAVSQAAAKDPTGTVVSAAHYLGAAWAGVADTPAASASPPVFLAEGLADEDPAVVTARLEKADPSLVPAAALVAWLGDPHAPLRALARRRLRERNDPDALLLALRWLDEPRVPHAAAEVRAVLDRLGSGEDLPLARRVLAADPPSPGALAWAAEVLAVRGNAEDLERVRGLAKSGAPGLRAAAVTGLLRDQRSLPVVLAALDDPDEEVRAAALAGWERRPGSPRMLAAWAEALVAAAPRAVSVRERRAVAEAAALLGDAPLLARAAEGADPATRAVALAARAAGDDLPPAERARALADEDPWIRAAVLDADAALAAAVSDPDPWIRRQAMILVLRAREAVAPDDVRACALASALAADPFLRARAADLLAPEDESLHPEAFRTLLRLSQDRAPMVRAAAASALEAVVGLEDRLLALLDPSKPEPDEAVRTSAYTWLLRDGDDRALARLALALAPGAEGALVKAHLEALTLVLPDEAFSKQPSLVQHRPASPPAAAELARKRAPVPARPEGVTLRPLGTTGLFVSPLVVSGAHGLVASSFADARDAGVNAFFWEPRYHELTRFLRSRRAGREGLVLVAGTYHSGPDALRADVERTLARLRIDWIDVFLLFWVRSPDRLADDDYDVLARLRDEGKLRAFGFSTHDRAMAVSALQKHPWPVVMTRHSAAHPGAEALFLPEAVARGTGVLTFTATSYGRLLRPAPGDAPETKPPSAPDCYRYSLTQPGVSATLTAPRSHRELLENLTVLARPTLPEEALPALRAHGERIRAETRRFDALVRRAPGGPRDRLRALLEEDTTRPDDALPPEPKM